MNTLIFHWIENKTLSLKQDFIDTKDFILEGYGSKLQLRWQVRGQYFGCRTDSQTGCGKTTFIQKLVKNSLFSTACRF